ncbi:hypothetical protein [Cognataquiflexum rubidum]|uniref:hypothetical protein n=1 Tax=Cognataquiflexum rubidum TaxID=2922273 RepID=UPI001F147C2F|nr:hypothetical protein [Cognataquiflexum rubidum]MCH6235484.1 hypothetical protein [Cognataquiflexum rubidum]
MKKLSILFLFVIAVIAQVFAQETTEKSVFDYAETKHEFSLDLAPIILGQYPSNLLYRNHYVSKNGKNVALRVGSTLGVDIRSFELDSPGGGNVQKNTGQSFGFYVGKEYQRKFHPRILGYYGADLSFSYGRAFNEFKANDPSQPSSTNVHTFVNLGAVGFLGMKYHFSKHFSLSVETSTSFIYSQSTNSISEYTQTASGQESISRNGLNFYMSPLRAIRFAFHF